MTQNIMNSGDEKWRKTQEIEEFGWLKWRNSPRSKTNGTEPPVKLNVNGTRSRDAPGTWQPLRFGKRVARTGRSPDSLPILPGLHRERILQDEIVIKLSKLSKYQLAHLSKDSGPWVIYGRPRRARFTMKKPQALFGSRVTTTFTASGVERTEMLSTSTANKITAAFGKRFRSLTKWFNVFK